MKILLYFGVIIVSAILYFNMSSIVLYLVAVALTLLVFYFNLGPVQKFKHAKMGEKILTSLRLLIVIIVVLVCYYIAHGYQNLCTVGPNIQAKNYFTGEVKQFYCGITPWYYQKLPGQDKQIFPVVQRDNKSASSSVITSGSETLWKTYTNDDIGYSFKYPERYTLHDSGTKYIDQGAGSVVVAQITEGQYLPKDCGPCFGISVIKRPYDVTGKVFSNAEAFARYSYGKNIRLYDSLTYRDVRLGEYLGVKVSGNINSEIGGWTSFSSIYVIRDNIIFQMNFQPSGYKYFEDMALSFRLIPQKVFIDSIIPSGASWGQTIKITGKGFSGHDTLVRIIGNTVNAILWGGLPLSDTEIQAVIPKSMDVCTEYMGGSGKPCPSYQKLLWGTYEIYIDGQNGRSNSMKFDIFRS